MRPRPRGRGISPLYSILFSRTCAPVRERFSILSPILAPAPPSAPLTPAVPHLYPSASAPRLSGPDPPLAPDYRVVNTGYSALSPHPSPPPAPPPASPPLPRHSHPTTAS